MKNIKTKKWVTPILTALFKDHPEHRVLNSCKWTTGGTDQNQKHGGCWVWEGANGKCEMGCMIENPPI